MKVATCQIATLLLLGVFVLASAQPGSDGVDALARRLSDAATRDAAVAEVAASGAATTAVLLGWTTKPPAGVRVRDLNIGLAEAFGVMKTEAAVPFLIRVIALKKFDFTLAPWLKEASNVEFEYPAAKALIQIGPPAAPAVISAAQGPMTPEQGLLAIFVVGQTDGVPGAREFLTRAVAQANQERVWAERGLELLKSK